MYTQSTTITTTTLNSRDRKTRWSGLADLDDGRAAPAGGGASSGDAEELGGLKPHILQLFQERCRIGRCNNVDAGVDDVVFDLHAILLKFRF
jgi:hypothetical protein